MTAPSLKYHSPGKQQINQIFKRLTAIHNPSKYFWDSQMSGFVHLVPDFKSDQRPTRVPLSNCKLISTHETAPLFLYKPIELATNSFPNFEA